MAQKQKIRVVLADDHLVVRMGLAAILSLEPDIEVVGEADNGRDAVRLSEDARPDVIIMDLLMPVMNGVDAVAEILRTRPSTRILILTSFGSSEELKRVMALGASGALVKTSSQTTIIDAIREIDRGRSVISPEIAHVLKSANTRGPALSERQLEVLNLAAKGFSNPEIAQSLGIGVNGVKEHLKIIYERLGVANRTEATSYAINSGLISG